MVTTSIPALRNVPLLALNSVGVPGGLDDAEVDPEGLTDGFHQTSRFSTDIQPGG